MICNTLGQQPLKAADMADKVEKLVTLRVGDRQLWATVSREEGEYMEGVVVYDDVASVDRSLMGSPIAFHKAEVCSTLNFDEWYAEYMARRNHKPHSKLMQMIDRLKL